MSFVVTRHQVYSVPTLSFKRVHTFPAPTWPKLLNKHSTQMAPSSRQTITPTTPPSNDKIME